MAMKISEVLRNIYYNPRNPASFRSAPKLLKEARKYLPQVKINQVRDWLTGELTYTLHKPARRNFKRSKYLVTKPLEQFQADLVDMRAHNKYNKPFNYILTVIDCFSKYAFAVPLKNKTGSEVVRALSDIFNQRRPTKLQTDRGKEFLNSKVQKFLKDQEVHFFTTFNTTFKCAIVERFNRTLKKIMYMNFTARGKNKYIDILQDMVDSYNEDYHRTIKARPVDVTFNNADAIFTNIYNYDTPRQYLESLSAKPKLKPGDSVRRKYDLSKLDKSFYPNWSDEIYKIDKSIKSQSRPMYAIKDSNNKIVPLRLYPEEVQKIKPNTYRIEKIIKTEKRKGKDGYIVKWTNYPSNHNSWIAKEDLIYLNYRARNT